MFPTDLTKLIKKYLNANKTGDILLLADLIDYANNLFIESITRSDDNKESTDNLSKFFTKIGFTNVVNFDQEYNTYTLSLNQIDYINKQQVIDFVNTLLDYINYLDQNGSVSLDENLFIINRLLYKYKFNNYLLIMYNDDSRVIYRWMKSCSN